MALLILSVDHAWLHDLQHHNIFMSNFFIFKSQFLPLLLSPSFCLSLPLSLPLLLLSLSLPLLPSSLSLSLSLSPPPPHSLPLSPSPPFLFLSLSLPVGDYNATFTAIEAELRRRYKGHILPPHQTEWVFINAGGWMGAWYLLHASLTEYVLLFGTAVDTSGHSGGSAVHRCMAAREDQEPCILPLSCLHIKSHKLIGILWAHTGAIGCIVLTTHYQLVATPISFTAAPCVGRYWACISDTVLSGTFRQWKEGTTESQLYERGDYILHDVGEAAAVQWSHGTWMLEYGRGFIPSTMGFGMFSDTLFGSQDFYVIYKSFRVYAYAVVQELLQGNL